MARLVTLSGRTTRSEVRDSPAMTLRTRLLLPLIVTVTAVMALYANWSVRQREASLLAEDRREAGAFASALGLALEAALVDPEWRGVQDVVERLSRDPQIFGVRVYGPDGSVASESASLSGLPPVAPDLLADVLEHGGTPAFEREVAGARMQVLLRPLRGERGESIGAFEVTLPLSFIEAEMGRTRTRFLLNTLTLVIAMTVLLLWLVRRQIGEPLERLVTGVQAVGAGELAVRIPEDPRASELAAVAREFNRMAERLERARADLLREADERVQLERRLRETDKLAAVGQLAAGLAHEIAAPLQIIKGRTDLLEKQAAAHDVSARNLRIIGDQVERVATLVRALLDLSRRPELKMRRIGVSELVEDVFDLLEPELERAGIALSKETPPDTTIEGDRSLLHQALMNLVLNAIQALEEHDGERRIHVRARRIPRLSRADAPPAAAAEAVALELEDTGPGIPPEALDHIFEPFFSTKGEGRGTGLGLSVARSIVEEHGGLIRAENIGGAPNGAGPSGARFRVELPLARNGSSHA